MKTKYKLYSRMDWLQDEISRNLGSSPKNNKSDLYYDCLSLIKEAQERELITDEIYSSLNSWKTNTSAEYGYYHANIHYELFQDSVNADKLEDRIIHFLEKSDANILANSDFFSLNFIYEFASFLEKSKGIKRQSEISHEDFIKKSGTDKEKKILRKYLKIMECKNERSE